MTTDVTRTPEGRFPAGVSGNPAGRPPGKRNEITELKQDLELAIRKNVSPAQIGRVVQKVVNKAMNGNLQAAKLILDHFISKASDTEEGSTQLPSIRVTIENATFAATRETPVTVIIPPVEGQFTEVSKDNG